MVSLSVKPQRLQMLQTKKALLGAVDSSWSQNWLKSTIIKEGSFTSTSALAEAIKATALAGPTPITEPEMVVVLPHSLYTLARIEIPSDTPQSSYQSYLKGQFHAKFPQTDGYILEHFVKQFEKQTFGFIFGFPKESIRMLEEALITLEYKLTAIVPEHLVYYVLFERALRVDKQENILYVSYEHEIVEGFLFDTFGPIADVAPWRVDEVKPTELESVLERKVHDYALKGIKLNRLVLAGADTEKIRQDTFTKNVGVWMNPLKRIVPNFYREYLDMIQGKTEGATLFPVLALSDVFGAFVCDKDGKVFHTRAKSHQKKTLFTQPITHSQQPITMATTRESRGFRIPKELILFIVIFAVTFGLFFVIAKGRGGGVTLPFVAGPTQTPTPEPTVAPPTPTPTVEVDRKTVKVRVLNGTGVAGQANGVKSILESKGYIGVTTGNADTYNYTQSVVQTKKEKAFLEGVILEDIKASIASAQTSELEASDSADVVIIIGKDVK